MGVSKEFFENQVLGLLGPLEGVARRLTGNDAEAEDLVAETVARAWRALHTLESDAAFRSWMFRILNNTFISERRRAGARPRTESIDGDEADAEVPSFSIFEQMHQPFLLWFSNPEQEFLDKLLREDLDRALATLPEHHRVVVILSDLEECNYAEIAEMLEIPIGTVRSRLGGRAPRGVVVPAGTRGRRGGRDVRADARHPVRRTGAGAVPARPLRTAGRRVRARRRCL
jgi:RNA polymerase sigma-70 factor (ECF subfamily)